jgi:dTDP-4-amino-4,6-dideoxygalactose transaminase
MIPVNLPQIGNEEIRMVSKVLKSRVLTGRLGSGPMAAQFEKGFTKFVKAKHAVAVNSGTAALHLALRVAGVKTDDEVVVPSFTFIASAEAICLSGAKPVFVDIDQETYNVDPNKIETAITEKTRAIMPVDLYGLPPRMDKIRDIADKHGLKIIEDAAQGHGASYKGKPAGSFADMACWSFYASKNMTTGEGGMITTDSDEYASFARAARSHGETQEYVSTMLGQNYRMPEIEASIGVAQLKKLPTFIEKRRRNATMLTKKLSGNEQLVLPNEPKGCRHSWYLYTVRIREGDAKVRDKVVQDLRKLGVGAAVYYHTPIHMMPYYRRFGEYHLPNTERIAQRVFSLPVHPGVTVAEIEYIAKSVKQAVTKHISI